MRTRGAARRYRGRGRPAARTALTALVLCTSTPGSAAAATPAPENVRLSGVEVGAPITGPIPARVGPPPAGAVARVMTPTKLFLAFDGMTLRRGCGDNGKTGCSRYYDDFGGAVLPYAPGQEDTRATVVQAVRSDLEPFGIIVTDRRPPDSEDYTTVAVGDAAAGDSSVLGFAGIAASYDCGDSNPNDLNFALDIARTGNVMATVINQEAAHSWGLEHVSLEEDNLYPTGRNVLNPVYVDECAKIVADTDLTPFQGECTLTHRRFCDPGYQNSYQEMLYMFGPTVPDVISPTLTLVEPADGATFAAPVDFDVVFTLEDDRSPHVIRAVLTIDGEEVFAETTTSREVRLGIQGGLAPGSHNFVVTAVDEGDNAATTASVTIVVTGTGEADAGSDTTAGTTTGPGPATGDETGSATEQFPGTSEAGCRIAPQAPGATIAVLACWVSGLRRRRKR